MSRLPKIIVSGVAHPVTKRGNRRQRVFGVDDDYALYKDWLAKSCRQNGVEVTSYCLLHNHVHLILVPADDTGSSRAIGEMHRRYSSYINARLRVTGNLFQGRFGSVAMEKSPLLAVFRSVEINPVKTKMLAQASDWVWSCTKAHLSGKDDGLASVPALPDRVDNISEFFAATPEQELEFALEMGQYIGRPLMEARAGGTRKKAKATCSPRYGGSTEEKG